MIKQQTINIKQQAINPTKFILLCIRAWNSSVKQHVGHLDKQLCLFAGLALFISITAYFLIPYNTNSIQAMLPEHVAMYAMVDSFPQRAAYKIFLCVIIGTTLINTFFNRTSNDTLSSKKQWPALLGILVLLSAIMSIWISNLDVQTNTFMAVIISIAIAACFSSLRWIAWTFIAILTTCSILPGWLHTPEPVISSLKLFDQHYDAVIYRGRQLAAGHLFFVDVPPHYGMLWSTIIGIIAKKIQIPSFASLIRLVQASQVLCLAAFALAGWLRTRTIGNRTLAIVFLAAAIVPWLGTDSDSIWYPNQSGLRCLMMPAAICLSFLIGRTSATVASMLIGLTAGLALIANIETGVAVTASLGMAWLVQMRTEPLRIWLRSAIIGMVMFSGVFFTLAFTYHYFFGAWPLPSDKASLLTYLDAFTNNVGGLEIPFRPLVIVILMHAGYQFMVSLRCIFNKQLIAPDAMTITISTMLLIWFPYYINRPDDWNLWNFIAIYSLLLAPLLVCNRNSILPFIVASFIVIPITVRNIPYFMVNPFNTNQWHTGYQEGCAGGLVLPKEYCTHLDKRAKTLQYFASKGTVAWSTALPVLTDQTSHTASLFWTGNLFSLSFTKTGLDKIVSKIKQGKIDYLLFDNPSDPFIMPRPEENAFNNRLFGELQNDYCTPRLHGEWLVAQRKQNGHCA